MSNQIVIHYYTQPGCRPCTLLKPHLDGWEKKYTPHVVVSTIDVSTRMGAVEAERRGVQGIPTLVVTRGKEMTELARHRGFKIGDEKKIEESLRASLGQTNSGPESGKQRD
jgi:thiol-disulfide isomerase/thioredoxin